jgi:hypothetical protein
MGKRKGKKNGKGKGQNEQNKVWDLPIPFFETYLIIFPFFPGSF